jgi:acyl carrier protein
MSGSLVTIEDLRNVLIKAISVELGVAPTELATDRSFAEYGVDSLAALSVAMELEDAFGLTDLPPTLLWDYPTVDTLTPALWNLIANQRTLASPEAQ